MNSLTQENSIPVKSTVALIFAGGAAGELRSPNHPDFKALVPVHGRPVVDYVIQALMQSYVEKIFILQDQGAALQDALTVGPKCVFLGKDPATSLALATKNALRAVAEYYGTEIYQKSIMIVPCDTPLVTPAVYNTLIEKAAGEDADVIMTIIACELIDKRYPNKHSRSAYLADYKARYTAQSVTFLNGAGFIFTPSQTGGLIEISYRGLDEAFIKRMEDIFESARTTRQNTRQNSPLVEPFMLGWIIQQGWVWYAFKLIFNIILHRMTMVKLMAYIQEGLHVKTAYIESEAVEITGDIDTPEDYQIVLGITWRAGEN
jgi:GTP:adenosylcobinamide-phosphate guanylyltransferase